MACRYFMSAQLLSLLFALLACSCVLLVDAQTNLLVNGDFETCTSNQATATSLGRGTVGWYPYAGRVDAGEGLTLIGFRNTSSTPGPNYNSFSQYCCYILEAETLELGITQQAAVTAGTQYVLSFYAMVAQIDRGVQFNATYQWNTAGSMATSLMDHRSFPAIPFWWTQFKFTITPPTGATAVNITFAAQDWDYGVQLDTVTLYAGTTANAPAPPPALKANPSNNLLINGDFESGSAAPWTSTQSVDPYDMYSGTYAWAFVASPVYGVSCPQGQVCLWLGTYTPYTWTTTINSLQCGYTYQLSFLWYNPGGYNASNSADTGASFTFSYGWGNSASTVGFADQVNRTAAYGSLSSPIQTVVQLGTATSTTLSLAMSGQNYATEYMIDYIIVSQTGGSSASCSSPQNNAAAPHHSAWSAGATLMTLVAVMIAICMA